MLTFKLYNAVQWNITKIGFQLLKGSQELQMQGERNFLLGIKAASTIETWDQGWGTVDSEHSNGFRTSVRFEGPNWFQWNLRTWPDLTCTIKKKTTCRKACRENDRAQSEMIHDCLNKSDFVPHRTTWVPQCPRHHRIWDGFSNLFYEEKWLSPNKKIGSVSN